MRELAMTPPTQPAALLAHPHVLVVDGAAMRDVLKYQVVDLLVLDLGLRGEDGMSIARRMRDDSEIPMVMLTGRAEEADRVMGLELGADDYITKPFSPREL